MNKSILLIPISLLFFVCARGQKTDSLFTGNPNWVVEFSYNLPEFYNHGFGLHATYYGVKKDIIRFGPSLQVCYFFTPYKQWFPNQNQEKSLISELHLSLLANLEIIPFRKKTFFIGLAPYLGFEWINNRGRVSNTTNDFSLNYQYNVYLFDWGSRIKLGGWLGKKKKWGLDAHAQFSHRGISDKDPQTKWINIGLADYKSYLGISLLYRIR